MTCLCQKGSDPPRASREIGSDLETSTGHRPARDGPALASPGVYTLLEVHVQSGGSQTEDLHRDRGVDQGDGQGQPTVGSGTDPGRITQAGSSRLQADHSEVHEAGSHCKATRTELENLLTYSC
jgi:hypothetical protein